MSLNNRNDETRKLAADRAQLIEATKTGAITVATQEPPETDRRQRGLEERDRELRAIAERCAKLMDPGPSAIKHGWLLYDEHGLPR